jgi:outer membrane protein
MIKFILFLLLFLTLFSQKKVSLEKAIGFALENNYQYKMIQDDLEYSEKNIIQSYLNYIPTLTLDHTYFKLSDYGFQLRQAQAEGFKAIITGYADTRPPVERDMLLEIANTIPPAFQKGHRSSISVQWNIFAKGLALKVLSRSKKQQQILEIEKDEKKLSLIYDVREAYFNSLISTELNKITKMRLSSVNSRLEQIERLVNQGLRNQSELLRWQYEKSKIEEAFIESESQMSISMKNLAYLIGEDLNEIIVAEEISSFDQDYFPEINENYINEIDQQSFLVVQKQLREVEIAQNNKLYTYGKFLPSVDVNWRKSWQETEGAYSGPQSWELSLNFSWEIFSAFKDYMELQKEEVMIHKNELALADLKKQVQLNLLILFSKFESSKKQSESIRKSVVFAEENYRIAQNRYQSGLITNLELLDSEIQANQSKIDRLNAFKNYILAGYSIKKLIGKY